MNTWTRRGRIRQYIDTAPWPIPVLYVFIACILGVGVPWLDRLLGDSVPAQFGVGAAQALLTAFATGLITVMGFIISVVIAGLTFSSTTITPRIVREMQRNTTIRHVSGLLLLSVVYAFLVLNRVAPPNEPGYVPDLAVWMITPLLVVDVAALLMLVREMGHALRVVETIDNVHRRVMRVIDAMYPEEFDPDRLDGSTHELHAMAVRTAFHPGVVANLDVRDLVEEAARIDTTFELACSIGSYVPPGGPLLFVSDAPTDLDRALVLRSITLADERTIDQDPLYALRLLVDIATRALSPAVNDPTTAIQALDRIEAILGVLAGRRLAVGNITDDAGRLRLVVPMPGWEDYVAVAITEIRQYGASSTQVTRRLRAVLDDLLAGAPESRRPALTEQLELLDRAISINFPDPVERRFAAVADRLGLGEPSASRDRTPTANVPRSDGRASIVAGIEGE